MESIIGQLVQNVTHTEANNLLLKTPKINDFSLNQWGELLTVLSKVICNHGDDLTRAMFEMDAEKNSQIVLKATANLITIAGAAQVAAQRIINLLHAEGHEVVITYDSNLMMQITTQAIVKCKVCGKPLDETAIKETQLCTPCFTSNA